VGPEFLADDEIRNAVAIHVRDRRPVRLRESDIARVLRREVVHDHVLDERDVSVGASLLLVPREAVPVRAQRGDDVFEPVVVDVINGHQGAAIAGARADRPRERDRMVFP
jgi:hypothetical protein